jgi:Rod binding domain-containing protein
VQVGSIHSTAFPAALAPPALSAQESFAGIMAKAARAGGDPADRARQAAEQFVAITFVQPVLKQLRETTSAAPPFAPSEGEKQFRALLDADLAQRIVHKARFGLVDRVARDLLNRSTGATPAPPVADEEPHR